jgi:hypothetical protein
MLRVGFELTIPAFERENTVHAIDRAATVKSTDTKTMNSSKPDLFLECSLAYNLFLPLERETFNEPVQLGEADLDGNVPKIADYLRAAI